MRSLLMIAAVALAVAGCTQNPQTNRELKCAGGVLGGAAVGGLLGNQIGGGSGKQLATGAGAGLGAAAGTHIDACQSTRAGGPGAGAPGDRGPRARRRRAACRAGRVLARRRAIDTRGPPGIMRIGRRRGGEKRHTREGVHG